MTPPDPLIHCDLYREHGCTHVDSFLCDVRTCTVLQAFKQPTKETPIVNTEERSPSQPQPAPKEILDILKTEPTITPKSWKDALKSIFTRYACMAQGTEVPTVVPLTSDQPLAPDVFLGGTCAGTTWRTELTALIKDPAVLFNPVCPPGVEWNEAWRDKENEAKEQCSCHVYVLTPQMEGVYSIAELTADAISASSGGAYLHTFFVILDYDESSPAIWSTNQRKSLDACADFWKTKGAEQFETLEDLALCINDRYCDSDEPWNRTW